jgi:DNA-binding CsgD family transcriptional regulator
MARGRNNGSRVGQHGDAVGERALMSAVLVDALDSLAQWRRRPVLAEEARLWIESCDRSWPFSFENLCDALGFDAESVRRRVLEKAPSPRALRDAVFGRAADVSAGTHPSAGCSVTTEREHDVMRLIALGFRTREIGAQLGISPRTVLVHVSNICRKLNVRDRRAIARYAMQMGLAVVGAGVVEGALAVSAG